MKNFLNPLALSIIFTFVFLGILLTWNKELGLGISSRTAAYHYSRVGNDVFVPPALYKTRLNISTLNTVNVSSTGTADTSGTGADKKTSKQPNIIFILADDYGYHDIGYHGSVIQTPVLDKLAADGVTLENYYVQSTCSPTRLQLMSGRYQIHTGMQHSIIMNTQPRCLPFDEVTLPEKLREAGYSTHMVGKWHAGKYKAACLPHRRGFDSFFGIFNGMADHYRHTLACGRCKCKGVGYDLHENDYIADPKRWSGKYSTTMYTDRAIDIIANASQENPLFLYVAYQAVHTPMQAPKEYISKYKTISDLNRRIYSGMVTYMDYSVGRMVDALKANGKWNNTVLVFSTDNGGDMNSGGNNWPLRGRKGSVWEGGVRGIGFVSSPLIPSQFCGRISHDLIHVTDWFPTLVKGLAGGSLSGTKPLDGFNVWDTIKEKKSSPRTEILIDMDPVRRNSSTKVKRNPDLFTPNINAAIRVGDWKLVTHEPITGTWVPPPELASNLSGPFAKSDYQTLWLFNIKEDPLETNDLSKTRPDKVHQLLLRLQHYNRTSVPVFNPPCDINGSPALYNGLWLPWGESNWKPFTRLV